MKTHNEAVAGVGYGRSMPSVRAVLPSSGPARVLAVATLVNTFGSGLFFTGSVLFFTRVLHLSATQVGVGLSAAGLCGMLVGVPFGHLADRRGPREVLVALMTLAGLGMAAYAFVHTYWWFLAVACIATILDRGASGVRASVVATVGTPADRVRTRAYLRSLTNVGIGLGSLAAGVAIHVDSRPAYLTLIVGNAVTYVLAALVLLRLPHVEPVPRTSGPRLPVLRDRPYLAFAALNGVLSMHFTMIEIGVPLWVVNDTTAPRWTVALVFLVNTVVVALFQVRASRGTDDVGSAARVVRTSGVLIAAACLVFAAAGHRAAWVSTLLLVVAALVHVLGEMRQSAGSWGIAYGLAPDHLQGQYQGLNMSAFGLSSALAPVVVATAVSVGVLGWVALGLIFLTSAAAQVPVAAWAQRHRPVDAVAGTT